MTAVPPTPIPKKDDWWADGGAHACPQLSWGREGEQRGGGPRKLTPYLIRRRHPRRFPAAEAQEEQTPETETAPCPVSPMPAPRSPPGIATGPHRFARRQDPFSRIGQGRFPFKTCPPASSPQAPVCFKV